MLIGTCYQLILLTRGKCWWKSAGPFMQVLSGRQPRKQQKFDGWLPSAPVRVSVLSMTISWIHFCVGVSSSAPRGAPFSQCVDMNIQKYLQKITDYLQQATMVLRFHPVFPKDVCDAITGRCIYVCVWNKICRSTLPTGPLFTRSDFHNYHQDKISDMTGLQGNVERMKDK